MKLKVGTEILKSMLVRSVKGMGRNKQFPITSLMLIKLEHNTLTLLTTDNNNYLYVKRDKVEGDDFYVVIQGEQFARLISKFTCEKTELIADGNSLEVIGNGKYHIAIPLDEGEYIQFPDPVADLKLKESDRLEWNLSTVNTILESCKLSLAVTYEDPQYTGYYIGEDIITTNDYLMSRLDIDILGGKEVLVRSEYMELLGLMTEENFSAYIIKDKIVCTSPDCVVYGELMEEDYLQKFQASEYRNYMKSREMKSSCKLDKTQLLSVLDRISLFVDKYDEDAVRLTFTEKGVSVESLQSTGVEVVPYIESKDYQAFTGIMFIAQLMNVLKSYPEDVVEVGYGDDAAVRLTSGNLTFLIAWVTEEEEGEEEDGENES